MKAVTPIRNQQARLEGNPERLIDSESERLMLGNILARGTAHSGLWWARS